MLFNFHAFLNELRDNPEKKEVVEKYEKHFGTIEGDIDDQIRYKEYIGTIPTVDYRTPEELEGDFDWELLMQLVAGSFSSDGMLKPSEEEEGTHEFVISVQSGDQVVVKKVSELRGFQVLRLFEIYVEEQMNLQILIDENEEEKEAILAQRESRIKRWNVVLDKMDQEQEQHEHEKEKSQELENLYDQL